MEFFNYLNKIIFEVEKINGVNWCKLLIKILVVKLFKSSKLNGIFFLIIVLY